MTYQKMFTAAAIAALLVAAGCGGGEKKEEAAKEAAPAAGGPVTKVDPATAATITGKVSFAGKAPAKRPILMDAEPDCKGLHATPAYVEEVVANANGTLANVFVYVKAGLEGKNFEPASTPVMLDQQGCIYKPHVIGVRIGQKLSVSNSDPTTHNVHPMPKANREWNQSQPPKGQPIEKEFARPEVMIAVKCNVHPWMRSYIGVVEHPFYAVTGDTGAFEIKGLPPGDYTLEAWHEKFGTAEQKVTLATSATQTVEFSFKGE
ncbi:MAG: carboxypeptidase regulatory-like domain-containing protein [Acidobacteria bacterium]|nr:carboxypeptidase regulatory-like domain-containing protein [Acidobacteriota bacterium]